MVIELLLCRSTRWPLEVLVGEVGGGAEGGRAEVAVDVIGGQHGRDWREGGGHGCGGQERRVQWPGARGHKVTACE